MTPNPSANGAQPSVEAVEAAEPNVSGGHTVFGEIGSSRWGIGSQGESSRSEEIPELRGEKAVKAYREMRLNEPIVAALVMATKMIVRGVTWNAELPEGAEENDTEAERARLFLQQCMADMSQPYEEMVDDSLEAIIYGFEPMEIVYKQRFGPQSVASGLAGSEFNDGLIGWRKIAHRDQLGVLRWDIDEHGGIHGMVHRAEGMNQDEVFIPIEKMILFRASRQGNDPQGLSWLRGAYRPYKFKRNHEWLEGVAADRGFAGLPMVEMPTGANQTPGSQDLARAKALVENVRTDGYMGVVLPPALGPEDHQRWRFSLVGQQAMGPALDTAIRRYGSEITTSVLAHFLNLGMQTRGAYALSRDQRDLWHLSMAGLTLTWAELKNRFLVRPLFELNQSAFPDRTKWPRIVPGDISQHDIEKVQSFVGTLLGVGALDVSEEDRNRLRALIGWPPETQEQRERQEEEREAATADPLPAQPPPSSPSDDEGLSAAEQAVGKRVADWLPEDGWMAAMALEDST